MFSFSMHSKLVSVAQKVAVVSLVARANESMACLVKGQQAAPGGLVD